MLLVEATLDIGVIYSVTDFVNNSYQTSRNLPVLC